MKMLLILPKLKLGENGESFHTVRLICENLRLKSVLLKLAERLVDNRETSRARQLNRIVTDSDLQLIRTYRYFLHRQCGNELAASRRITLRQFARYLGQGSPWLSSSMVNFGFCGTRGNIQREIKRHLL